LGQHVGDFFRPPRVVTPLLALAASGEIGASVQSGALVNKVSVRVKWR
jgi:hypothetical protein